MVNNLSNLNINDLPEDVILEIFYNLTIRDMLSLRQVCHRLYNCSVERSVWSQALFTFSENWGLQPFLEHPMRAYSSAQLERMVQRQVQVQHPLDHGMAERSSRVIQADLLPGGRWLLIMSAAGSITAWDLESSPPLGSMIIHQDTRPGERPRMASLCVYGDDDYLKLDIAISTCLVKAEGVAATRCIIWKVHLDPLKGLQAEHSSAFDVNDSWISNGSLGEGFYAGLFLTQRGIKSGSGVFSQTLWFLTGTIHP
ncbi:hypothetical protein FRC02_002447 [Tulasnella sp. 418]|nr:hypothetical protein FRC02_002447 [Tulasnella sp. 418]